MPKANPHPYVRVQALIERIGPLWQEAMGLGHYDIRHKFLDAVHNEDEVDNQTTCETQGRWQYLYARLLWNLPTMARQSDEDLEWILVHEYGHVLLLSEQSCILAKDAEKMELATEMVARALMTLGGSKL